MTHDHLICRACCATVCSEDGNGPTMCGCGAASWFIVEKGSNPLTDAMLMIWIQLRPWRFELLIRQMARQHGVSTDEIVAVMMEFREEAQRRRKKPHEPV